ncbi:PSD1 and planctomycete cytochrome C domain-containing protein [Stieleria sp. ICT_E10.1]|uniref:PSD1 and planctomycete cytochrome C domain-containing protein n=1 Tax=Stieleria sedimenti TaxID=2976331 RepID=UPI00217F8688|nr:PSD1 and planctomycete cytochrome C domain-containing protein [Stieleria sedimenti]MCS7471090.1 PSD1 and planctomycete cytochrome C domain-containing protein [Stieleria sedimenti]
MAALKNLTIAACLGLVLWDSPAAWCQTPISFNSQIRPILSEYCFACHGPDEETRAADLRLDQREPAVDYGAIVEGEPGESLLIDRIESEDPDMLMPPPETGKTLTTAQKELIAEWIRQGGEYQKHWSFEPLPETVAVPEPIDDWPRTSVDPFVAQTHREKGFQPNGEADKATWLRRVTFDLTGLPPTLPELDAFLAIFAAAQPGGDPPNVDPEMALQHHLLSADETVAQARRRLAKAREVENELVTAVREIMTMRHDENAPPTHVLGRGEYTNKQEQVSPGTPELAGELSDAGDDRLSLAKWMTDPQNPLTSRVIVNRMWHLFFGRGIVVTLEDFGSQGTPPSHPELLDHLARSLMDNDWDLHWLCREIVLSSTYRQSSKVGDPQLYQRDRDNTWLTRGPKHRLSAEQLRDTVLAASGLLVKKIGGPSVMPYQPAGLWRESGTGKSYNQSTGDGLYRRSLYTFWKRTAPPPTMLTLDATSRESCTPRRELTTTPLQALVFLNDPQYVEASRVLAESLVQTNPADRDARWNELFRRLLSRLPHDRERKVIQQLYDEQLTYFSENESDAGEFLNVGARPLQGSAKRTDLAATTIVVQALFAYDETIMLR